MIFYYKQTELFINYKGNTYRKGSYSIGDNPLYARSHDMRSGCQHDGPGSNLSAIPWCPAGDLDYDEIILKESLKLETI